jgi:hypothetical protein
MIENVDYPKPCLLFWAARRRRLFCPRAGVVLARLGARHEPARRAAHARGKVAGIWLVEVFGQPQLLLLSRVRWAAHLGISWGFLGLVLLSALHVGLRLLEYLTLDGGAAAWFQRGDGRAALKIWGNVAGPVLLAGLLLGLVRRVIEGSPADESPESQQAMCCSCSLWLTLSGLLEWLRVWRARPAAAAGLTPG